MSNDVFRAVRREYDLTIDQREAAALAASTAGTVGGIDGNRLQVVVLPPDE